MPVFSPHQPLPHSFFSTHHNIPCKHAPCCSPRSFITKDELRFLMQRLNQLRLDKQLTKVKVGKLGLTPSTVAHIQELLRKHEFLRVSTRWRQGRSAVGRLARMGFNACSKGEAQATKSARPGLPVQLDAALHCRPHQRCWAETTCFNLTTPLALRTRFCGSLLAADFLSPRHSDWVVRLSSSQPRASTPSTQPPSCQTCLTASHCA